MVPTTSPTAPQATGPVRPARVQGLDVVRGLAVALVLLQHAGSAFSGADLGAGIVGVVAFFALSGYLITGILLTRLRRTAQIGWRSFYAGRARRLLPPLIPVLLVYGVFEGATSTLGDPHPWAAVLLGLTYTADIPHLQTYAGGLNHLWTLAVEEQFYLVWPVVLWLGVRYRKLGAVFVGALVVGFLASLAGPLAGADPTHLGELPTSWSTALVIGAAARYWEQPLDRLLRGPRRDARLHALACFVSLAVVVGITCTPDLHRHGLTYPVAGPLVAAATVVLVFWVKHWVVLPHRAWRWPRALGTVSYAAYLWNLPLILWFQAALGQGAAATAAGTVATIGLAALSWVAIERPISARRRPEPGAVGDLTLHRAPPPTGTPSQV